MPAMAPDTAAPTPTADSPRRHQWQLPAFVAGLAAAACAYTAYPPQPGNGTAAHRRLLTDLQRQLDRKPPDLAALDAAAKRLTPLVDRVPADASSARYLLGSVRVVAAEHGAPTAAAANWAEANKHFSECDPAKLRDKQDATRCAFRAAKAAAAVGVGDPKLLIPALATLPPGEESGEARRLLAETCLRVNPPDLKRARDELAAYLGGNHRSPPATVARYKLKLGELCLSLKEPEKAQAWLKQLDGTAPPDVQAVKNVQLARLAAADNRMAEAVKLFEAAEKTPGLPPEQLGLVLYETGRGLQALNDLPEARKYYQKARAANGPAGVAATVRLASLVAKSLEPGPNPLHPAELPEGVVKDVKSAGDFHNPHVGVEELRATFEEVIQAGLKNGEYEEVVRAVAAYAVVAPPGRARLRQAETTAAWAAQLAATHDATAADKFKAAAADFTAAAVEQTDPAQKTKLFRRAAECYGSSGDSAAALDLCERWTKTPGLSAADIAPGLLAKADLLLADGKFADAVEALMQAAAGGGGTAARANLRLARAEVREADLRLRANPPPEGRREAEALAAHGRELYSRLANLSGEEVDEREVRQSALFELGKQLMGRNLSDAEARFRQLMQTGPTGTLADKGRLYLGTALQMIAQGANNNGRPPADADRKLAEAMELYEELSKSKEPFYRSQGDIRRVTVTLHLRKFDDLPALCDTLATRYRDRPEELIVLSVLHTGHLRADRPALAERAVARMSDAFTRIPTAAYTGGLEEMTQAYWTAWFDKARKR